VDNGQSHETERQLVGSVLQIMSDAQFRGRVVWLGMTSRPEMVAPDMKSRMTDQIPVLPLEGELRREFVLQLFKRKGIIIPEAEVAGLMEKTAAYSPRNFNDLRAKAEGFGLTVTETLEVWQASAATVTDRRIQTLHSAKHCSYKKLLTPELRELVEKGGIDDEIESLKNPTSQRGNILEEIAKGVRIIGAALAAMVGIFGDKKKKDAAEGEAEGANKA
jgi:hypothetical protein